MPECEKRQSARRDALVLSISWGSQAPRRVELREAAVLGREEGVDILLDDTEVSRRHAILRPQEGGFEIEDLGSLNGTWLNSRRIETPTLLSPEDVVGVGKTQIEVVSLPASEPERGPRAVDDLRPVEAAPSPLAERREETPSEAPVEDQLRPVTALFADVVGSTSLGERLPPDEVKALIGGCIDHMCGAVERFGGVIDAFMGDGIAAFFGFPVAREDDAERAASAALLILDVIDRYSSNVRVIWEVPDFNVRVGMNTGQVAVGLVGAAERHPVALGDTMNVAARLQTAADPGTVVIGGRTAQALRGRFQLEPLGEISVKGRDAPVETWRLLGAGPAAPPAPVPALVGRARETERLSTAAKGLLARRGQVLLILGEPGIGKTRLLEWFREHVGTSVTWLEGQCASYGEVLPYSPFVGMLREWLRLDGGDASLTLTRLRIQLEILLGPRLPEVLPYFASLLAVELDSASRTRVQALSPDELASEIERAYSVWARALSEREPVVLAIQDMHWADRPTRELAERLLEIVERAPLALAVTSRVEPQAEAWRFRAHAVTEYAQRVLELHLAPLSEAESEELLKELAPGELDESAKGEVIARAEGNPLYLEQLLRTLLESGGLARPRQTWALTISAQSLPSALESLLIARIDALPPSARRLAQLAAVVGRNFSLPVLAPASGLRELDGDIGLLLRADIIRELRPFPEREYTFTHGLLQEAALSTLTRGRRRELYRAVAEACERLYAEILDDHLERIAFYRARSGDLAIALGYLERAAARAAALRATTQAAELWKRAATIADQLGDGDAKARIDRRLSELDERGGFAN